MNGGESTMEQIGRKFSMIIIALIFCFTIIRPTENVFAASYPIIIEKEGVGEKFERGEKGILSFFISNVNGYKYVRVFVNIYYGNSTNGTRAAYAEHQWTNKSTMDYAVSWDTSDYAPGNYTVEYYVEYYSLGRWNETPYGKDSYKVEIVETSVPNNYNGLAQSANGNWYYYSNGTIDNSYTGLYCDKNVGWWLVRNGKIDFNYTGLWNDPNVGWWLINTGTVAFDYTGWYYDPNFGNWYIRGGAIDFSVTAQ